LASTAFTSALWFIAVMAMIPLALWLLRRTPLGVGAASGSTGLMRHIAALSLSPQHRVVTIEVGSGDERRWLVLGVTPQGISTLHTMAPQAEPVPPGAAVPSFSALLGRLRKDPGATP
jgi:flagellar protein FliO/FliZ